MRVLLIEDEPELASALRSVLGRHGVVADHASCLAEAARLFDAAVHQLVLLDRRLPDGDGLDFLPRLRAPGANRPVIVLTAQGDVEARVAGLDLGADDYVSKPFDVTELLARMRAVMRRGDGDSGRVVTAGSLAFDPQHREATVHGRVLDLPRRELLLLEALVLRAGRIVPRHLVERAVFGYDDEVGPGALDTHLSRLRKKLADADPALQVHTVRGVGYVLKHG